MTATSTQTRNQRITPAVAATELLRRRNARARLLPFCSYVQPTFIQTRHHAIMADALEAVDRGEITRLMVFMPPRHGKSRMVSQMFPCWALGRQPERQIVQSGYALPISMEHSRYARDLFVSPEFRRLFPEVHHVPQTAGQEAIPVARQAAQEWGTVQRGRYYAVGVGGGLTGRGADIAIIDDPVKDREEANSPIVRKRVMDWYRSTLYTRLSPRGAVILVMTRWHVDDLAGNLIREMNAGGEPWHIIEMPAIDKDGIALWPDRFPLDKLELIKGTIGQEWEPLYQQHPTPEGGCIYLRDWFAGKNRFNHSDIGITHGAVGRWISLDTAMKAKDTSDYTAAVVGDLQPDYRLAVKEVYREKLIFPDLVPFTERLIRIHNFDDKLRGVVIEDKASGISLIQTLRASLPERMADLIIAHNPGGDKEARSRAASIWCANGSVMFPHPAESCPWLHDFEEELFNVPVQQYWDQADAFSQLVIYLENLLSEGFYARSGGRYRAA